VTRAAKIPMLFRPRTASAIAKTHVARILAKLQMRDRGQLVVLTY
jgi:hypothetical protein